MAVPVRNLLKTKAVNSLKVPVDAKLLRKPKSPVSKQGLVLFQVKDCLSVSTCVDPDPRLY